MSAWPPPGSIQELYGSVVGPSSYAAGGFVVDLSSTFNTRIDYANVVVEVPGALPLARVEITRDSPSAGKFTVKLVRVRYDRSSTTSGRAQNPPAGVTVRNASGTTAASIDAVGGAGAAHTRDLLYDHDHPITVTQTDTAAVEIANGTNLSTTTFRYVARGS